MFWFGWLSGRNSNTFDNGGQIIVVLDTQGPSACLCVCVPVSKGVALVMVAHTQTCPLKRNAM